MRKILFYGNIYENCGPCNVNKALVKNSDKNLYYAHSQNRIIRLVECFFKILAVQVVAISSIWALSVRICRIAKLFHKKVVYIMHGCVEYETVINKQRNTEKTIRYERYLMEKADLILCVSEYYSDWLKKRYPQFEKKISFLNNGVDFEERDFKDKIPYSIAVSGGNRNIKNNHIVCEAVQQLNKKEKELYTLYVFGRYYPENINFFNRKNVIYVGQLEKKEYYNMLDKMELFILNSELESFGLVVADAINCHCSLLLSQSVGAASILTLNEEDIIKDCHDIDELSKKIQYTREHSNAERIAQSVDQYKCSKKYAYKKFLEICKLVEEKEA